MGPNIKKQRKIILSSSSSSSSPPPSSSLLPSLPPPPLRMRVTMVSPTPSSPELPGLSMEFRNLFTELNGYDLNFLMHKKLFPSDVKPNNNRLSIPMSEIKCDFLTQDEIMKLDEKEKRKIIGLEVTVLDPCMREYTLPMKKWTMKSDTYNLVKEWNKIVATNKFKVDEELQIWSFRVNRKLYFFLNKL